MTLLSNNVSPLRSRVLSGIGACCDQVTRGTRFSLSNCSRSRLAQDQAVSLSRFNSTLKLFVVGQLRTLVPRSRADTRRCNFNILKVTISISGHGLSALGTGVSRVQGDIRSVLGEISQVYVGLGSVFRGCLGQCCTRGSGKCRLKLSSAFGMLSCFTTL